jgi:hypothetical protein
MHLQVCGGEEKGRNTRARALARSLTSPGQAGRAGVAMGMGTRHACE